MPVVAAVWLALCLTPPLALGVDWDVRTPIDEYIAHDDGHYNFSELERFYYNDTNVTMIILNMTSQKWTNESWVDRPIWWHEMGVAIPDVITHGDWGMLYIGAGRNRPGRWGGADDFVNILVSAAASETGTICGYVKQIPNQPLRFMDDDRQENRTEDRQIAWTWRRFAELGAKEPRILSRFPMTKASVKALDTIATVASQERPGETNVTNFMALGASKRGWTTWMLAATDRRVKIAVPIVMSAVNVQKVFMHHYRAMNGAWSFALHSYWRENITKWMGTPEADIMFSHVDAYSYRERLTCHKLVISGSADEFFFLDDSHYWWDAMPEPKRLMMLPNAGHTLAPHYIPIGETLIAYFLYVVEGQEANIPRMTWMRNETEAGGSVTLQTSHDPKEVIGHVGDTREDDPKRDFRMFRGYPPDFVPMWFNETEVESLGNRTYRLQRDKIPITNMTRWRGLFIETVYDGPRGWELTLTSEVNIIPDVFPAPPCHRESCLGPLV